MFGIYSGVENLRKQKVIIIQGLIDDPIKFTNTITVRIV